MKRSERRLEMEERSRCFAAPLDSAAGWALSLLVRASSLMVEKTQLGVEKLEVGLCCVCRDVQLSLVPAAPAWLLSLAALSLCFGAWM